MRIVGGHLKGLKLATVGKGADNRLRPTSVRTRTRLFDLLTHGRLGNRVVDARVLDLFAGTGALGIEAMSRGAQSAHFVEKSAVACRLILSNTVKAGLQAETSVLRKDATSLGHWFGAPFDLVLADPPYGKRLAIPALRRLIDGGWLAPDATIVLEESSGSAAPGFLEVLDQRQFGQTSITCMRLATG